MSNDLRSRLDSVIRKAAAGSTTLQCEFRSPSIGLEYSFSSTEPGQFFHSASVGKLMTATLAFLAIEQKLFSLDTEVASLLPGSLLRGLFADGPGGVTVRHLLGHTSGVNDYFEGIAEGGHGFIDKVLAQPDRRYRPEDLLEFTRSHQHPVGKPGATFCYSDTGYILLGLAIEKAFGMPFHKALRSLVSDPVGMRNTGLCFYDERFDARALAAAVIRKTDIHLYESLSCDFSGGGLWTTTGDLTLFLQALRDGRILSSGSLAAMASFEHKYRTGMEYGLGMMRLRFEQFFFLLRGLPRLQGHLGVLGVHAWYHPEDGDTYVLNTGNADRIAGSFMTLIKVVQLVEREKKKRRGQ